MRRLAITVEGQTERAFVRLLLTEHLRNYGVETFPILLGSGQRKGAVGGDVSVKRLAGEMIYLLRSFDAVTSLVDYYGFRKKGRATVEELEAKVRKAIGERVRRPERAKNLIPYIQLHEFEALLFSEVGCFGDLENVPDGVVEVLRQVRERFETPEDIDDGRATAPSKRILAAIPDYDKVAHGSEVARCIGLPGIRAKCLRFDRWVRLLEALGSEPSTEEGKNPECR